MYKNLHVVEGSKLVNLDIAFFFSAHAIPSALHSLPTFEVSSFHLSFGTKIKCHFL